MTISRRSTLSHCPSFGTSPGGDMKNFVQDVLLSEMQQLIERDAMTWKMRYKEIKDNGPSLFWNPSKAILMKFFPKCGFVQRYPRIKEDAIT